MVLNPWMDITTAAIVFFRRHTAHKTAYAAYRDLPTETYVVDHKVVDEVAYRAELAEYNAGAWASMKLKWWQIPVSQKQCTGIRADTLAKYAGIIEDLSTDPYLKDVTLLIQI